MKLLVLPRRHASEAALAAAKAGELRTIPLSAFPRDLLPQVAVDVPIVITGVHSNAVKHLARNNRCIPINGMM